MTDVQTRIQALQSRIQEAWTVLSLDAVAEEIAALETMMNATDFWQEPDRARRVTQSLSDFKRLHGGWDRLRRDVGELEELVRVADETQDTSMQQEVEAHLAALESRYIQMEFSLLLSGDYDAKHAIVAVHAGAGGTDAQDWAEMLLRMLIRYAERKEWEVKLLDESRGTEAGIKSATFFVHGSYAYGQLKSEHGVHRLVRQSPFNADALRQTSFALVEVIPEMEEDTALEIDPKELRVDTFMSGGKGGQSVNTTYSAVRIVHLPTNITVSCQNERSQTQNREMAMRVLRSRLVQLRAEEREREKQQLRGAYQSAEWGNQIRSYVLHPYKMVKDHRTDVEVSDPDRVLDGDLDVFVEGYLRWKVRDRDVRAELNKEE